MKLPVDTSAIAFLCAMPPEPVSTSRPSDPAPTRTASRCMWCSSSALAENSAEILAVKVPGMPSSGIRQGHPVKVVGLVAQPWTMGDRSGVAFRAARIDPALAQAKAS